MLIFWLIIIICHHPIPSKASHCTPKFIPTVWLFTIGIAECLPASCWMQAERLADVWSFKWLPKYVIISSLVVIGIFEISLVFPFACLRSLFIDTTFLFYLFIMKLWLKSKDKCAGEPFKGDCLYVVLCFSSELMWLLCIYVHFQICLIFSGEKSSSELRKAHCCKGMVDVTIVRERQRVTLKNTLPERPKPPLAFNPHRWKLCLWVPLELKDKRRPLSSGSPWQ